MKKRAVIRITGRVQGVNFRNNTEKKARSMDLTGFVKNMPDGSVLIEAEGEEENLDQFIEWSQEGPRWSRVDQAEVQYIEPRNDQEFTIKYQD